MRYFSAFFRGLFSLFWGNNTALSKKCNLELLLLAGIISLLMWAWPLGNLAAEEERIWDRVREAQTYLYNLKTQTEGSAPSEELDPSRCGLIGIEWSPITTTVGSLHSKQISCNPIWAVIFSRWFNEAGLNKDDRIAIFSSGSFPGFLVSSIIAAEEKGLDIFLQASLGASSYGANDPNFPLPGILMELRKAGFISTKAAFYTLGGDYEIGGGIPQEGIKILLRSAQLEGVPVIQAKSLQEVINTKMSYLQKFNPSLVVQIGGSHSNMGTDEKVLSLPPGFLDPKYKENAGNGIIALTLKNGIPVIHVLNVKKLCRITGVPEKVDIVKRGPMPLKLERAALGMISFTVFLLKYKRWTIV